MTSYRKYEITAENLLTLTEHCLIYNDRLLDVRPHGSGLQIATGGARRQLSGTEVLVVRESSLGFVLFTDLGDFRITLKAEVLEWRDGRNTPAGAQTVCEFYNPDALRVCFMDGGYDSDSDTFRANGHEFPASRIQSWRPRISVEGLLEEYGEEILTENLPK